MNAALTLFVTRASPGSGENPSRMALPGRPGAKAEPGSTKSWRT